jgi:DNA-directed RNA polymerase subunit beta'
MQTTIGQVLVNDALPEEFRDHTRVLTKGEADKLLGQLATASPEKYKDISFKLMDLGREASFTEGTTLKLSDTVSKFDKSIILKRVAQEEAKIGRAKLTPAQKTDALDILYGEAQRELTDATYDGALALDNPFALQVKSKARGNKSQLAALMTTPSVYQDADDRTIPVFIGRSYAEGLDPSEYWAATYGARKAIISTKFATRDAGALGKQFGVAVSNMVVTGDDCGTPQGIPVKAADNDNIGSVLAQHTGRYPAGTVVSKEVLADMAKDKIDNILVRSPVTCSYADGICKQCSGLRENGKFPEIGHHLGLNAASALAERIAQSQLNMKHSGGQTDSKGDVVYSGFDIVDQLSKIPKTFPHRAAIAELDGDVQTIEPAPQGGFNITIGDQVHYVGPDLPVTVKVGDTVEAGDSLSKGIVNPADAVQHKGIGEGRRYFMERLTQAMRDSNYEVSRRNVEVLARSLVNHVSVTDPDGVGDALPGDMVDYNALAYSYKPRTDARMGLAKQALGQYLEQPALHYSIGTRVTKNVVGQLSKYGVDNVMTHAKPPGFAPEMVSVVKVPEQEKDWMARLGSTYLQSRLLEDVHRGSESHTHSINPIPGIAKGVEFGQQKGPKFTY